MATAWTDVYRYYIDFGDRIPHQSSRLTTCIYDTPLLERNMDIFARINHHLFVHYSTPTATYPGPDTRTTRHARYLIVRFKTRHVQSAGFALLSVTWIKGQANTHMHIDRSLRCLTPNSF